jgi:hypothetical protein
MGITVSRPESPTPEGGGPARDGARVAPETEATVFFGSERHHLALQDLSASGAALTSRRQLPKIGFLRLHLRLTRASAPLEIEAVPVRQEEMDGGTLLAVRFLDPPPHVVGRIEAFIARRAPRQAGEEE